MAKGAQQKRAPHPRACDYTKAFSKDWARLSGSGRYDMNRLKSVMLMLIANDAPLGPEWKVHPLKGEWSSHRECHVGGDFLLIYKEDDAAGKGGTVVFVRAGTHADLFGE
jgi:mRNA interferase YafQ